MKGKYIAIGLILLLISFNATGGFIKEKNKTSTISFDKSILYVGGSGPNNYTTIQSAVDNANNGDTVFVYNGTYNEYDIIIYKSINLVGEHRDTTIIDANNSWADILWIKADGVHVSGFTIKNAGHDGIYLDPSNNSTIIDNNIISNSDGIYTNHSLDCNYNIIQNNFFDSNDNNAIYFSGKGNSNNISYNIINDTLYGISLDSQSYYNTIIGNIITNTNRGIGVYSDSTKIKNNDISNSDVGLRLSYCLENTVSENKLENNFFGVLCESFENGTISDNIFENNKLGLTLNYSPYHNTIINNSFYNDGLVILGENSGNIYENNTINGKNILVLENESDKSITEDIGQIILIYCNNITIEGKEFSNTSAGIQVINSDNCHIRENKLTDNVFGIYVDSSFNNIIFNNNINDSLLNGITLISCFESTISDNKITGNGYILNSSFELFGFFDYYNISGGIFLLASFNNSISKNIIYRNYENGITFILSSKNAISENTISNNYENGIIFILTSKNNVFRNHIELNNKTGIILYGSITNKMIENSFLNNGIDAFFHICFLNRWKGNFWSESRILPKIIKGMIGRFNWINIDWRPAQEPYDI